MSKLSETPLAYWLDEQMALWRDPETNRMGLSQRQMAIRTGLPQSMVNGILISGHIPQPKALETLGQFFECHPLILHYFAYFTSAKQFTPDNLHKLTELGQVLYQMPDTMVTEFLESQAVHLET